MKNTLPALLIIAILMSCGALHAENNEPNKKSLITKQEHTTSLGSKSGTTSTSISHIDLMASIREFNKDNCHLILDKDFDSNITIAERVILGFQQSPPKSLSLKDGTQIVWGWQEGQAWIQSVAILDNNNVAKYWELQKIFQGYFHGAQEEDLFP